MVKKITSWLSVGLISAGALSGCNTPPSETQDSSQQPAAQSVEVDPRGEILALSCASCHGTDGKSVGILPGFYGKSASYLKTALMEFKKDERYSTVMGRHAKGYSDEEIELIAEYFGSLSQQNSSK
ncbi:MULTISPECIES: c-type cytochrome [unclassified Prosthecochloris]|uniref:c-type cytochrome n=1 Tax=unclassified Prosthecochloris TaxID=2632826 RepID=UPI00223DF640|nr:MULTISPECIES: c-type cytochrome [unclassified Prosthecochloris]UZJ37639.1 sulfide dehydrogenase [Prosthecochloris sp. SCSIO W1103]UZJ39458.1 sulfide dehydrogenase [Prosthecochloris sp. SCSIO W1102]UZJ41447.1 sulfide dehydrogenase [Prosthecochloris sp. SCSIO W1101]